MQREINQIRLSLGSRSDYVNCYLVKTEDRYTIIDTGAPKQRPELERKIGEAGCKPGDLKLIILTHGDYDHSGNAGYLRSKYGAKIGMHPSEFEVVEKGDMLSSRKNLNFIKKLFGRLVIPFMRLGRFEKFKPDLRLEGGTDISGFGLNAKVVHIPGHSEGSIGILTGNGDLFCGDLLVNGDKPSINSLIDDPDQAKASVDRLKSLKIETVYPGHGRPFPLSSLI